MNHPEIFEPFEDLVEIRFCGKQLAVPDHNTILRGLQFLDMDAISYGEFCWNGECLNCQVWITADEKERSVMACRSEVKEGLEVVRASDELMNAAADILGIDAK